jgi:hypothetical protein
MHSLCLRTTGGVLTLVVITGLARSLMPAASNGVRREPRVGRTLSLNLRSRAEAFKGSGVWQEVHFQQELLVQETAILSVESRATLGAAFCCCQRSHRYVLPASPILPSTSAQVGQSWILA